MSQAGSLPPLPVPKTERTVPKAHRMVRMERKESAAVGGGGARMAAMAAKAIKVVMVAPAGMVATAVPEVGMGAGEEMGAKLRERPSY